MTLKINTIQNSNFKLYRTTYSSQHVEKTPLVLMNFPWLNVRINKDIFRSEKSIEYVLINATFSWQTRLFGTLSLYGSPLLQIYWFNKTWDATRRARAICSRFIYRLSISIIILINFAFELLFLPKVNSFIFLLRREIFESHKFFFTLEFNLQNNFVSIPMI